MSVNLRGVKNTDVALIKIITKETAWESIPEYHRKTLNKEEWSRHMDEVFETSLKREGTEIFVAESEDHIFLGYVLVGEATNMITGTKHGFIYDIFVKENHRRRGIGRILMKKAEQHCSEKGYKTVALMVTTDNKPAINLYKKLEFRAERIFMEKIF